MNPRILLVRLTSLNNIWPMPPDVSSSDITTRVIAKQLSLSQHEVKLRLWYHRIFVEHIIIDMAVAPSHWPFKFCNNIVDSSRKLLENARWSSCYVRCIYPYPYGFSISVAVCITIVLHIQPRSTVSMNCSGDDSIKHKSASFLHTDTTQHD